MGRWASGTLATGRAGRITVAVLGQHALRDTDLAEVAASIRSISDVDRLARSTAGSAHIVASVDGVVRIQGTVTGVRRLYQARIGDVTCALWDDARLGRFGLVDVDALRDVCAGPLLPHLPSGVLYQTIACEAWLRTVDRAVVTSEEPSMTYDLQTGVSTAETDYGLTLLDERSGEYFQLNPTGALVLSTLLAGGTRDDAIERLMAEFAVDRDTASRDVADLMEALQSADLVTLQPRDTRP
jgi:hypothetical protein